MRKWQLSLIDLDMRNIIQQRKVQREWIATRRRKWLTANGPCNICGSWSQLEVDHIDPTTKIDHKVWSWTEIRRLAELAKCQVLCRTCHLKKTMAEQGLEESPHGANRYLRKRCRCDICRAGAAERMRVYRLKKKTGRGERN